MWSCDKSWWHCGRRGGAQNPAAEADMGWGECRDQFKLCREWALKGECESNRPFMVGTAYNQGRGGCVKSCSQCKPDSGTLSVPSRCKDTHEMCPEWASTGECRANPTFMVGSKDNPGQCLLSCGTCDP